MKKGIVFPAEFLIRLAVGIMFAVLIVIIGCKVFTIDTGGNAPRESFDKLVQTIRSLDSGEVRTHELVLDKRNAIAGFTKESGRIELLTPQGKELVLERPPACPMKRACLCYCKDAVPGAGLISTTCSVGLQCLSFDNFDFPDSRRPSDFLPEGASGFHFDAPFNGGFVLRYYDDSRLRHVLSLEREGNLIYLCDHPPCAPKTS